MTETKNSKYDIGIMGFWYGHNYGSILTYFALNRVLRDMGKKVLMIENPKLKPSDFKRLNLSESTNRKFSYKYYECSKPRYIDKLYQLNEYCDNFLLGSDQVFNPNLFIPFKTAFFLSFAAPNKRRIAYAASFGKDKLLISDKLKVQMAHHLRKFESISVRENSAVEILKDNFNIKSEVVLDPVFLCPFKYYIDLIEEDNIQVKKNNILAYILNPNESKREVILHYSKILNKDYINILDYPDKTFESNKKALNLNNTKGQMPISEFLAYYKNTDFVITDSFHGTCFAILFKKPFISLINEQRGATRFISLLSKLNLLNKLVYKPEDAIINSDILLDPIDYDAVYKIIEIEKNKSIHWLQTALEMPVKKKHNLWDLFYKLYNFEYSTYFKYYRYKLISKIPSKKQQHYITKASKYHDLVRKARRNII